MTQERSNTSALQSSTEHGRELQTKTRGPGGRWKKGETGNPNGRPRTGGALAEAIRRKADPDELAEIALKIARTSKSEAYRLQALTFLADRGYIRPPAQHEVTAIATTQLDAQRVLGQLSDDALRELVDAADRAGELGAGDGPAALPGAASSCTDSGNEPAPIARSK